MEEGAARMLNEEKWQEIAGKQGDGGTMMDAPRDNTPRFSLKRICCPIHGTVYDDLPIWPSSRQQPRWLKGAKCFEGNLPCCGGFEIEMPEEAAREGKDAEQ